MIEKHDIPSSHPLDRERSTQPMAPQVSRRPGALGFVPASSQMTLVATQWAGGRGFKPSPMKVGR